MKIGYLLPLLLAACGTPPTETVFHPVSVAVPVPVDCRAPQVVAPDWPLAHLPPEASVPQTVRAMLAEIDRRKAYEAQLAAALAACR